MKITPLEQSGLIITTNSGVKLGIDIGAYTPLTKLDNLVVDAMLVSHLHGDHFSLPHIQKLAPPALYLNRECRELVGETVLQSKISEVKVGDEIKIADSLNGSGAVAGGIKVQFFNVDHGPNVKVRPVENFGFLISVDEGDKGAANGPAVQTIYFAGDMFYPSGIDVSALEVDVALIPVGGFYTFGPAEAVAFAKTFKRIGRVIPMHYEKTPETKAEFERLAREAGISV